MNTIKSQHTPTSIPNAFGTNTPYQNDAAHQPGTASHLQPVTAVRKSAPDKLPHENTACEVTLIGRLGSDPRMSTLKNGCKVARMRLATRTTHPDTSDAEEPRTQWHNLVAWSIQASFAERQLSKGRQVLVRGKVEQHTYTDKAGLTRSSTKVRVLHIKPLDSRPQAA